MKKVFLAVIVLCALLASGYGIHRAYRAITGELNDEEKSVREFLALYDANDYSGLYLHCDSIWKRRFNVQQSQLEFEHWRRITGPVTPLSLLSARSIDGTADKRAQLVYRCEANQGGVVRLYITIHREPDWRIAEMYFR